MVRVDVCWVDVGMVVIVVGKGVDVSVWLVGWFVVLVML